MGEPVALSLCICCTIRPPASRCAWWACEFQPGAFRGPWSIFRVDVVSNKARVKAKEAVVSRAAEFFVMSQLIRQGHEVVPTLGGFQGAELLVKTPSGRRLEVVVRGVADSGRWMVNAEDEAAMPDRVYVLLNYKRFDEARSYPMVYVLTADRAQAMKTDKGRGRAIVFGNKKLCPPDLDRHAEAWSVLQ